MHVNWITRSSCLHCHPNCTEPPLYFIYLSFELLSSISDICAFLYAKEQWKRRDWVFLLQASEDAKRLVNQERSFACAEIESARSVVQRIGEALDEEERNSPTSAKQVLTKHWSIHLFDISIHFPFSCSYIDSSKFDFGVQSLYSRIFVIKYFLLQGLALLPQRHRLSGLESVLKALSSSSTVKQSYHILALASFASWSRKSCVYSVYLAREQTIIL